MSAASLRIFGGFWILICVAGAILSQMGIIGWRTLLIVMPLLLIVWVVVTRARKAV